MGSTKKRAKPTAEEKKLKQVAAKHKAMARKTFRSAGFVRMQKLSDREFCIGSTRSDFDDVYVYENIVVLIEYTASKKPGSHLKSKKIPYDCIERDPSIFLKEICKLDTGLKAKLSQYNDHEIVFRIVYCSRYNFDKKYKLEVPNPIFLDYPELRYFSAICDCLKKSSAPELFEFLNITVSELGDQGVVGKRPNDETYEGSLLPEANSNFEPGFKVVSFYIDPAALLRRSYVLRKQSWRHLNNPYQRMISKAKIESIRFHLKKKKRVFVNNIIATLDDSTKILDQRGNTVKPSSIKRNQQVRIQLPDRMNTVGLIDGQHRTFSYYESAPDDEIIEKLRKKQNLLVTGIIYPENTSERQREIFEARLFLEINSTQTNAKSDLKQAINLILEPFSDESIATRVLDVLDRGSGPLSSQIERHWFDENKLKTTSIISYAMKPLVKTSGNDSLFCAWDEPQKAKMVSESRTELLNAYVDFCRQKIDDLLIEVRKKLPSELWTPEKRVEGRILTTTNVNCMLICLRLIIQSGLPLESKYYEKSLQGISTKDFKGFHSSRYKLMANKLFETHFRR